MMDTTSDLLKVCNDTRDIVANILKGKRQLKRSAEEDAADASTCTHLQLSSKRARSSDEQQSIDNTTDEQTPLTPAHDRQAFYRRLETFSDAYINRKRPVTAVQCAMHGFSDTHVAEGPEHDIAKLECADCHGTSFVIDVSKFNEKTVRLNHVVEKYTAGLRTYHRDGCFWRTNACAATIYSFPKLSTLEAVNRIRDGGVEWLQCDAQLLPKIVHPLDSRQLGQLEFLIRDFQNPADRYTFSATPPVDLSDATWTSYVLALFGWCCTAQTKALKCMDCFREKEIDAALGDAEGDAFDVVSEHREYCPWINRNNAHVEPPRPAPFMRRLCGYEWMLAVVELEYELVLRLREESPVYQASRHQWLIDEQKRIKRLHESLDREFPIFSSQRQQQQPLATTENEPAIADDSLPGITISDEQQQPAEKEMPLPADQPAAAAATLPAAIEGQATTLSPVPAESTPLLSPSPVKQDDDDLGEYLESENEVEEDEKKVEAATAKEPLPEKDAEQTFADEEDELDESLLEEVDAVVEQEEQEEQEKEEQVAQAESTTDVALEGGDQTQPEEKTTDTMEVDNQPAQPIERETGPEPAAEDEMLKEPDVLTLEDHVMDDVAAGTPVESDAAETTMAEPAISLSEDKEKDERKEEPAQKVPAVEIDLSTEEQHEEPSAAMETPLDTSAQDVMITEQQQISTTASPTAATIPTEVSSISDKEAGELPQPAASDASEPVEAVSEQLPDSTAEVAPVETPQTALQRELDSEPQAMQVDQGSFMDEELKEFAETPSLTADEAGNEQHVGRAAAKEAQETDTAAAQESTAQSSANGSDEEPAETSNEPPAASGIEETTKSTEPAATQQELQDELLLEGGTDISNHESGQDDVRERHVMESAQDNNNVQTPLEVYEVIEEQSADITEASPAAAADNQEVEQDHAQTIEIAEKTPYAKQQGEPSAKDDEPLVEEDGEPAMETNDQPALVTSEPLAAANNEQIAEEQVNVMVEEASSKSTEVETPAKSAETEQQAEPTVTVMEEDDDDDSTVPSTEASTELRQTEQPSVDEQQPAENLDAPVPAKDQDQTGTENSQGALVQDNQQQAEKNSEGIQVDEEQRAQNVDVQIDESGSQGKSGPENNDDSAEDKGQGGKTLGDVEVEVHEVPDSLEDGQVVEEEDIERDGKLERGEGGKGNEEESRGDVI